MGLPIKRSALGIDEVKSVAHGLTAASVGKPIGWKANGLPEVWNDVTSPTTSTPVGILLGVINANRLKISSAGDVLEVPNTLLPGGMPVDGSATNSRFLYWDLSAGVYVHSSPVDAAMITESIYWIGAGDTAAHGVCICLHPNRPSLTDVYLVGGGSFREVADKASRLAITPLAIGDRVMQLNIGLVYYWTGTSWLPEGYFGTCDTLPDVSEAHVGTILYNKLDDTIYKRSGTWIATIF